MVSNYGYIFLGGALGAMARYMLMELAIINFPNELGQLVSLFVVNLLGAYLLGLTVRHPYFTSGCKNLWGTGFAGGFTTMSGVTVFMAQTELDQWIWGMLIAGFIAFSIGFRQGRLAERKKEVEFA
jgi:CrcB protein